MLFALRSRENEISKTHPADPRYWLHQFSYLTYTRAESGEQLPIWWKLLNGKRERELNTADNNPAVSNNNVKHVITVSSENGFMIPRISFGKLCAATYASAHATLLPRALRIIVKNYSAGSIRELVFSDLSEL